MWAAFGAVVVMFASMAVAPAAMAGAAPGAPRFRSGEGLGLVSASTDGQRTWSLVVSTAALSRPVRVSVLLPRGYDGSTQRYPVLYLFHGTSGGAYDWLRMGNAAAASAPYPLIVVMADAGYDSNGGSWFTNWVDQHTPLGAANWETFHIGQLVPWIDANLRTIASRRGRAIAGLSQGGFGSFTYASRHPDMFVSAASFSGAPDIDSNPIVKAGSTVIIDGTAFGLDGVEPNAFFGDPITDDINWQGHNPANLVTNLGHTVLDLWSGNGLPGPYDTLGANPGSEAIEAVVHLSSVSFAQVARSAGIAYSFDDYGPGTHTWAYWTRDLAQYLPMAMATFANPGPAPRVISYRSVDLVWTQWHWRVANRRVAAQAWSGLTDASVAGFTFTGSAATVTTPALFRPGHTYTLVIANGVGPSQVVASTTGRLSIPLTVAPLAASATVSISRP
jgi:S-formylglutathione hydrolase FrmB